MFHPVWYVGYTNFPEPIDDRFTPYSFQLHLIFPSIFVIWTQFGSAWRLHELVPDYNFDCQFCPVFHYSLMNEVHFANILNCSAKFDATHITPRASPSQPMLYLSFSVSSSIFSALEEELTDLCQALCNRSHEEESNPAHMQSDLHKGLVQCRQSHTRVHWTQSHSQPINADILPDLCGVHRKVPMEGIEHNGPVLGWACRPRSDRNNWSYPAKATQICLQPDRQLAGLTWHKRWHTDTSRKAEECFCSKKQKKTKPSWDSPLNLFTKLRHNTIISAKPSLPVCLPPTLRGDEPTPGANRCGDMRDTHSFGLGLVGRGRPSLPEDGDILPGVGGESRATWSETWAVTASSVTGKYCGSGGGGDGGGVSLGKLGGDGGLGGWPLCINPLVLSLSSSSEPICTGGRADTLGQISSSLTWKPSVLAWASVLGGSSKRLISVGGGGGGKDAASSHPERSPDMPLVSSAPEGNKQSKREDARFCLLFVLSQKMKIRHTRPYQSWSD